MMVYATFWQRFWAMLIDALVLVPMLLGPNWMLPHSKPAAIVLFVLVTALCQAYFICGHAWYGQTIGKHLMRVRIVALDGHRIRWRQALTRSSVELGLTLIGTVPLLLAYLALTEVDCLLPTAAQRAGRLVALQPAWAEWVRTTGNAWYFSEVVVMLFNERRRALHDFIAGTVVISTRKSVLPASATP